MKIIVTIFFCLFFISGLIAQEPKLKIGPVNPEFIKYMEMKKEMKLQKFTAEGHGLGYVPHPLKFVSKAPDNFYKLTAILDTNICDLRDDGTVSTVKDQSTCGSCWTFATMGSLESRWMTLSLPEDDLSENNLLYGNFYELDPDEGGNSAMATAYLIRLGGPISEDDDPYQLCAGEYHSGWTPQAYVTDVRFLPNDANVLKQILVDSGAVYTNMYMDDQLPYYNSADYTYYYNSEEQTNHAVLLVGWDSTKVTAAAQPGAWIIKNSWGTGWGESGYFYVSFYDTRINSNPAFWPNRINYDANATVHFVDTLGAIGSAGYSDQLDFGLTQFTIAAGQSITKLGTWVAASNTTINFNVYDSFDGTTLSGHLSTIGDQVCDYPGYYTFDLPTRIDISSLNDIYILVKYDSPGENYPVPIEQFDTDTLYAAPHIETGVCWISSNGTSGSWLPIGASTIYHWDLCIKAYSVTTISSIENPNKSGLPWNFELFQNSPNPFNPSTKICFNLGKPSHVKISIYDVLGKKIAVLLNENRPADDNQEIMWYGKNERGELVPSGVYFYSLETNDGVDTKKMLLIK